MDDFIWRLPCGWRVRTVAVTGSELRITSWLRPTVSIPVRLVRGIRRPRPGWAALELAGGRAVVLPERSPGDAARLEELARALAQRQAQGGGASQRRQAVAAWLQRNSGTQLIGVGMAMPRGRVWPACGLIWAGLVAFVAAISRLPKPVPSPWVPWLVLPVPVGLLWSLLLLLVASQRPVRSAVRVVRVRPDRVVLTSDDGVVYEGAWEPLSVGPSATGRWWLRLRGHPELHVAPLPASHPLVALLQELEAIDRPHFAGLQAAPPSDAALSRLTGEAAVETDRGLSRAEE